LTLFRLWLGAVLRLFRTRRSLVLENLALRQQLAVFKRQQPRPRLGAIDKLFWVVARRFWAHWKKALLIVLPDTVARWHRSGFKLYWAMLCKVRNPVGGGRRIPKQIRELIFQMVADNPSWGAPRIHGELLMLGFDVSETTISRWMKRAPKDPQPAKRWLAFLRNHREAIAAMDFFTVPTLAFGVLYCFFIIGHDRRRILHFNVTRHPTSAWIVQQLREAFPYDSAPRFLLLDHDANYGLEVPASMRSLNMTPVRTSIRRPSGPKEGPSTTLLSAAAAQASPRSLSTSAGRSATNHPPALITLVTSSRTSSAAAKALSRAHCFLWTP
jgi:putative transposase